MKAPITIQLTKGRVALVDAEDLPLVEKYKWCFAFRRKLRSCDGYAVTNQNSSTLMMHRLIIGAPKGMEVDHVNGDGLDNRKANLRLATSQQNKANRMVRLDSMTGMKGVTWNSSAQKWMARITINRKCVYLGCFETIEDAGLAYNRSALLFFGEFAKS